MQNDDVLHRFGSAVKQLRHRLGISQEELGGRAGLHRTYVSDIERGARNLSLVSIEKLSAALETPVAAIFARTMDPTASGDDAARHSARNMARILLVEDDAQDIELTMEAFKHSQMSNPVDVARDGEQALEYLFAMVTTPEGVRRRNPLPDLILLDLNLPKIAGIEVLRRIRADKTTAAVPVIVLTASQESADVQECRRLGTESYLVKPVVFENLSQVTPQLRMQWALLKSAALPVG
jgi:CheY-like chemotaxis protein